MLAERASASSLLQVIRFNVITLGAEGIVVVYGFPWSRRVPGRFLRHISFLSVVQQIHCALNQAGLAVLQKTRRDSRSLPPSRVSPEASYESE